MLTLLIIVVMYEVNEPCASCIQALWPMDEVMTMSSFHFGGEELLDLSALIMRYFSICSDDRSQELAEVFKSSKVYDYTLLSYADFNDLGVAFLKMFNDEKNGNNENVVWPLLTVFDNPENIWPYYPTVSALCRDIKSLYEMFIVRKNDGEVKHLSISGNTYKYIEISTVEQWQNLMEKKSKSQ